MSATWAPDPAGVLGDWATSEDAVVAIPDATRPLDVGPALAALRPRIGGRMTVVVGLGLHRRLTAAERAALAAWDPVESDPDDAVPTGVVDGIPGEITRAAAAAPVRISVGLCELHQYAGVSGGHKGFAVGCGGRRTVAALHARERVLHPGVRLGQVTGNPFRSAVDALGEAAGCRHALCFSPGHGWAWGDPKAVVAEAADRLQPWVPVTQDLPGVVLKVPDAKAVSLYQASRAATYLALSPRPPLRPGATLALVARCPEGLGHEAGFVRALQQSAPPWTSLLAGPEPTGPGAQRAVMLALLAQQARLVVVGPDDPAPFHAVGIETWPAVPDGLGWPVVEHPFSQVLQRA